MNRALFARDLPGRLRRLRQDARHVFVDERTLPSITAMAVGEAQDYFEQLQLKGRKGEIAEKIVKEVHERLQFLVNVGLEYLTLDRKAGTLSGGEAQRIRLASQIGAGLVGVMYILDEPSIGLHPRDIDRLIAAIKSLRTRKNTVVVVEHEEAVIREADFDPVDCTLDMASLEAAITPRTRLVALGYASNAVGSINDLAVAVDVLVLDAVDRTQHVVAERQVRNVVLRIRVQDPLDLGKALFQFRFQLVQIGQYRVQIQ